MATARPLRDVFADATGDEAARASDPAELLRANGHEDLPDTLVAEAVTSYADTAPVEVAEHLSPYVMANSAVPGAGTEVDPSSWLEVLSTGPEMLGSTVDPAAAGLDEEPQVEPDAAGAAATDGAGVDGAYALDLDFGFGEAVEGIGEAVETVVANAADLFGAAPTTGDDAFGAAAGDEAFGAASAPTEGTFGAAADLDDAGADDEANSDDAASA